MSVRINLAPEIYQSSQRNKKRKALATTVGFTVAVISVGFIVLMLVLLGGQKIAISTMTGTIKERQQEIAGIADLQKAATAQKHLTSWYDLSQNKTRTSRFFEILQTFVPQGIAVANITVSDSNLLEMRADAKNYALVTKFVKALEAANVAIGPNASPTATPFFTQVELSTVSEESGVVNFKLTTQMASEVTNGN